MLSADDRDALVAAAGDAEVLRWDEPMARHTTLRIGGMRLFPAVRREPAATLIAATGVSCRQQIAHGTGRPARHPVQLVREALHE